MSSKEVKKIKEFFSKLPLHPKYLEHREVTTSEEASKIMNITLKQGIKAILFTDTKNNWIVVDIPADKKVDEKQVATLLGWSKNKIRMATPEEIVQKTGCEIGAVPPFGHKELIPILVDQKVYENEESAFNIGLRTISVKIPTKEMKIVFEKSQAREGNFTK